MGFFCNECIVQLEFLNPEGRCVYCFGGDLEGKGEICGGCRKGGALLDRCMAAFDYYGPAATLVKKMKYGGQAYLAKGAASFMVAQFIELDVPLPDYVVPVPMPFLRKLERGYNQSLLIAQAFGKMIERPVYDCLKKEANPYRSAGMNRKQRLEQVGEVVFKGDKEKFRGKNILLIDDVYTTGATLQRCAEALWGAFPNKVEGMVLCRGM